MPISICIQPRHVTTHAAQRMTERKITLDDIYDAAADAYVTTQASGRREVRGRNGLTFITDPTGEIVLTVLPRGARPVRRVRKDSGVSRHRETSRGPKTRTDRPRP